MKRAISAFLVLLLLCGTLAGCLPQYEQYPGYEGIPVVEPPAPTETISPEQAAALSSLTDHRESIAYDQRQFNVGFLETDFASYCATSIPEAMGIYLLLVRPKGSDLFVPLCAKPNCAHRDMDCSAALALPYLGYMDGRIHAITYNLSGTGSAVVSMLADGTDRRQVAEIPTIQRPGSSAYGPNMYVFHENRLILYYLADLSQPLELQIPVIRVMDLRTGQVTEPFQDFLQPGVSPGFLFQPVGSKIIADCAFRDRSGAEEYWMVSMDMDTGEVQKLYHTDQIWEYTADETTLYYLVSGEGFMEYDFATGNTLKHDLPLPDTAYCAKVDDAYIYVFSDANDRKSGTPRDHTIYILTKDYQLVDQLYLGENIVPRYVDSEYIYFGTDNFFSRSIQSRLDKSAIGSGKMCLVDD